jgi:hypothetical protein
MNCQPARTIGQRPMPQTLKFTPPRHFEPLMVTLGASLVLGYWDLVISIGFV